MNQLSQQQRNWRWRILLASYLAYAGYYLTRKTFTIVKTTLTVEFQIGLDAIAHVWTVFLFAYLVGQFVNSYLGRKWGARILLLGGLGISILINVIFGFANSYSTLMVFMFFNGLVQASGWPGCVGAVAQWLRQKERGTIMGFWSTNYLLGNIVVKMLGGYVLAACGWRYAFWGNTVITFFVWWLIYFWQRNKPEDVGLEPIVKQDFSARSEVRASTAERIPFSEYLKLLTNPIVLLMGMSYFSIKFLRYALDSWLPTFLNISGLGKAQAAYYSSIFDMAGLAGSIFAGIALDRFFRSRWERLSLAMGLGLVISYYAVIQLGQNPVLLAYLYGLVGFMIYGPDTILCGAASVQVAGEKNSVAVVGIVNGIGCLGPVIQEEVIAWFMKEKAASQGIHDANELALFLSMAFVLIMVIINGWIFMIQKKFKNAT